MIGLNLFSSLDQVHYIQITSYFCRDIKFFAVMVLITWNNLYKYPFSNTVFNFSNVFFFFPPRDECQSLYFGFISPSEGNESIWEIVKSSQTFDVTGWKTAGFSSLVLFLEYLEEFWGDIYIFSPI